MSFNKYYVPACLKYGVGKEKIIVLPFVLTILDTNIPADTYADLIVKEIQSSNFYFKYDFIFKGYDTKGWVFKGVHVASEYYATDEDASEVANAMVEDIFGTNGVKIYQEL